MTFTLLIEALDRCCYDAGLGFDKYSITVAFELEV